MEIRIVYKNRNPRSAGQQTFFSTPPATGAESWTTQFDHDGNEWFLALDRWTASNKEPSKYMPNESYRVLRYRAKSLSAYLERLEKEIEGIYVGEWAVWSNKKFEAEEWAKLNAEADEEWEGEMERIREQVREEMLQEQSGAGRPGEAS